MGWPSLEIVFLPFYPSLANFGHRLSLMHWSQSYYAWGCSCHLCQLLDTQASASTAPVFLAVLTAALAVLQPRQQ